MELTQLISKLERELAELRTNFSEVASKIAVVEAQLASLRKSVERLSDDLVSLPRTEAILNVPGDAGRMLSPAEILTRLGDAGRVDASNSVNATLDYLLKSGRAHRPLRGKYLRA